ncbi:MAG: iron-containing alcohol dehydrogenase family protein [Cyanobacteria bacterium P01_D01_bin.105]
MASSTFPILNVAPAQVIRGQGVLKTSGALFAQLGKRPLVVGGHQAIAAAQPFLSQPLSELETKIATISDCSEASLRTLHQAADRHQADCVIGVGGGKVLDAAKLLAYQRQAQPEQGQSSTCFGQRVPVATVPTSAATCAGWTALSNVYSDQGAFLYDVSLPRCPELIVLDYDLIATAPKRSLIAGIGDAIAKWYEASVSSGHSEHTMVIGAVQQARVLRDILFQKSLSAVQHPGDHDWCEVVDASVLMAGVIGGMGGAQCRTVAAHAVHNGLTHVAPHGTLHGEKVAYGILVQLRLEEMGPGNALATTSRQQLLKFYEALGLPTSLADMKMDGLSVTQLRQAATVACRPGSDIHHLPFVVQPEQVMAAMVSTTVPIGSAKKQTAAAESEAPQTTAQTTT